eukprot:3309123-Rhodomonas_salina.2
MPGTDTASDGKGQHFLQNAVRVGGQTVACTLLSRARAMRCPAQASGEEGGPERLSQLAAGQGAARTRSVPLCADAAPPIPSAHILSRASPTSDAAGL